MLDEVDRMDNTVDDFLSSSSSRLQARIRIPFPVTIHNCIDSSDRCG